MVAMPQVAGYGGLRDDLRLLCRGARLMADGDASLLRPASVLTAPPAPAGFDLPQLQPGYSGQSGKQAQRPAPSGTTAHCPHKAIEPVARHPRTLLAIGRQAWFRAGTRNARSGWLRQVRHIRADDCESDQRRMRSCLVWIQHMTLSPGVKAA
jgi:hypothetical protein